MPKKHANIFLFLLIFITLTSISIAQIQIDPLPISSATIDCTFDSRTGIMTCPRQDSIAIVDTVRNVESVTKQPKLIVSGTEYQVGDSAKAFIQLTVGESPINDANCYATIFYPNNSIFIQNAPMIYLPSSNGNYYYPNTIANQTGVWILSAECKYIFSSFYFNDLSLKPYSDENAHIVSAFGILTGSTHDMERLDDSLYMKIEAGNIGTRTANITLAYNITPFLTQINNFSNITSIEILYFGESSSNPILDISIWNYSGQRFDKLPNTLTYSVITSPPSGVDDFLSNSIAFSRNYVGNDSSVMFQETEINLSNEIIIRYGATKSTAFNVFHNYAVLKLSGVTGQIQDVKGSSEWHVSDYVNDIKQTLYNMLSSLLIQHNITQDKIKEVNITANQLELKLDFINTTVIQLNQTANNISSILNSLNFNPSFNITTNITLSQLNETGTLKIGKCSQNLSQTLMIWLFVAIGLALLVCAFYFLSSIIGIIAGLSIFISAVYISPCAIGFGLLLGGAGIILILIFAFTDLARGK